MSDEENLRRRFGRLVQAHRRRAKLTQEALATKAELSSDMINRIEAGATGARFPSIARLAAALSVDPAEFFTTELPTGSLNRQALIDLTARLASMNDRELLWIEQLIDVAVQSPR